MEKCIFFLMFDIGTQTIQSLLVKASYSNENISQIQAINSRGHIGKTFGCLKEIDSFENSATFFTSIIEKLDLYIDIAKKNIRYRKFS